MGEHAEDFERGIELFNSGRYFEAHEEWEKLWLGQAKNSPPKMFVQGLIMVAGALDHHRKKELAGAGKLIEKGLKRLTEYRNMGREMIDIDSFLLRLNEFQERLRTKSDDVPEEDYPKIEKLGVG